MVNSRVGKVYRAHVSGGKLLLFFLIGMFLLIAPISVSGRTSREGDDWLKWSRVGILVMISFVALQWLKWPRMRDLHGKLLLLSLTFWASGIWSTSPFWAVAFKGMFLASIVAGLSLSNSMRTESDFRSFARMLTTSAAVSLLGFTYLAATQDENLMWKGRLYVAEINPNLLSQSAAVFSLLSLFHIVIGDRSRWMFLAYVCLGIMLLLVVLSGSRSAALMLLAGIVVLLPALGRRRRQTLFLVSTSLLILSGLAMFWLFNVESNEGPTLETDPLALRMVNELTKDTRMGVWTHYLSVFLDEPVMGVGWLHRSNRWSTVQSAYLQILVESGIIGGFMLLVFLIAAISRILTTLTFAKRQRTTESTLAYVFAATLFAILFHAAFESSAVTGASPIAVLLGFCTGQIDHYVWTHRTTTMPGRTPMSSHIRSTSAI